MTDERAEDEQLMPKALTRDELQARTRELIISAAERVFLARGYNATTIAQIAEEAGRTHGSIYGNFTGKEDLCLQVLRQHFEQVLQDLAADVLTADGHETAVAATARQWEQLLGQPAWIRLAADFMIVTRSDPSQATANHETLAVFTTGIGLLLRSQAATLGIHTVDPDLLEQAAAGLLATGIGLAIGHALGATPHQLAISSFLETVELWHHRIQADPASSAR